MSYRFIPIVDSFILSFSVKKKHGEIAKKLLGFVQFDYFREDNLGELCCPEQRGAAL